MRAFTALTRVWQATASQLNSASHCYIQSRGVRKYGYYIPQQYDEWCNPIPKPHPETPRYIDEYSTDGPPRGRVYDKRPFKLSLKAGTTYYWCACGYSHAQPLCDGSHKRVRGTFRQYFVDRQGFRPIEFSVEKDGDYWLCNCKQSRKRPFCDGTHRTAAVQQAALIVKV